jgi:hypothetical protein
MSGYKDTYEAAIKANTKEELDQELKSRMKKGDKSYKLDEKIKDERTGKKFTAASMLAYQSRNDSDVNKIKWLSELGANPYEIVKGYAMTVKPEPIAYYLEKYKNSADDLPLLRNACATGYIFANKHELVEALWKDDSLIAEHIAIEYALANNVDEAVKWYRRLEFGRIAPDVPSEQERALPYIFGNLAKNGFDFDKESAVKELYDNNQRMRVDSEIVIGYAVGGKTDLLLKYMEKIKEKPNFPEISNGAFRCSAAYGHHDQVQQLYKKYANKETNQAIMDGYYYLENYKSVNMVLKDYLENRRKDPRQYKYDWLPKFFQKSLTEKETAVDLLERALKGEKVDLISHLETLRDSKLGKDLRAFIKSGMGDYLEVLGKPLVLPNGENIRTVTDFVTVLDAIVNPKPGLGL